MSAVRTDSQLHARRRAHGAFEDDRSVGACLQAMHIRWDAAAVPAYPLRRSLRATHLRTAAGGSRRGSCGSIRVRQRSDRRTDAKRLLALFGDSGTIVGGDKAEAMAAVTRAGQGRKRIVRDKLRRIEGNAGQCCANAPQEPESLGQRDPVGHGQPVGEGFTRVQADLSRAFERQNLRQLVFASQRGRAHNARGNCMLRHDREEVTEFHRSDQWRLRQICYIDFKAARPPYDTDLRTPLADFDIGRNACAGLPLRRPGAIGESHTSLTSGARSMGIWIVGVGRWDDRRPVNFGDAVVRRPNRRGHALFDSIKGGLSSHGAKREQAIKGEPTELLARGHRPPISPPVDRVAARDTAELSWKT
jgi:hypothetical protein